MQKLVNYTASKSSICPLQIILDVPEENDTSFSSCDKILIGLRERSLYRSFEGVNATNLFKSELIFLSNWNSWRNADGLRRGYREALDGRLCRPDSEQRPLVSNFTTVAIVKLCCHNFTQIANLMIFFVSTISYRPTDLSLLKEFSKNVSF